MATLLKSWLKAKPNATRRQGKIAYTPRIPTDPTEHRPFFMPSSSLLLLFLLFFPPLLSPFSAACSLPPLLGHLVLAFILPLATFYAQATFDSQHTRQDSRVYVCPAMYVRVWVCVCMCKWLSACKTAHSAGQLNSSTNWIFMILFFMALSLLTELTQRGGGGGGKWRATRILSIRTGLLHFEEYFILIANAWYF